MRHPTLRLGLILTAAVLVGALNVVPAFAQGPYPAGGYMPGASGMSYGAPAPAAGSGYSAASSYRLSAGGMSMLNLQRGPSVLYVVRAGDTLSRIAARFGTSQLLILLTNPSIMNANRIFVGQFLLIPSQFIGRSTGDNDRDADDVGKLFYRVRFGDTLSRLARRFGVSQGALLRVNPGIFNPNLIFAGQTLVIPTVSSRMAVQPMPMPGPQATPAPTQAPAATPAPGSQTATVSLMAHNLAFSMSTIAVPPGAHVVVNFNNQDAGVPHNFAVYTNSGAQQVIFRGQIVTGPGTMTYTFTAPSQPGTYFFRCDVHPAMMNGQFVVR